MRTPTHQSQPVKRFRTTTNLAIGWNSYRGHLLPSLGAPVKIIYIGLSQRCIGLVRQLDDGVRRVLFHVDLTLPGLVPIDRLELIEALEARQIQVWNGRVHDITKRRVQTHNQELGLFATTATAQGDPDEDLIIKSDWNCYGESELRMSDEERRSLGYPPFDRNLLGRDVWYPVVKRKAVPSALWSDTTVSIERYVTNETGLIFRIYYCGARSVLTVQRTEQRVERRAYWRLLQAHLLFPNRESHEPGILTPLEQKAVAAADSFAASFGLDFGAIDVATDSHNPYIIDVNHTPFWGNISPEHVPLLEHLKGGLE